MQELLNAAWHTGETVRVTIYESPYSINPRQGWQDREDTSAPTRQVRRNADYEDDA